MHSFMDSHGLRFKILLVMCLSILLDDSSGKACIMHDA